MIGSELEQNGWRQGSLFSDADATNICADIGVTINEPFVLIVASQSCDIANNNLELDPHVEVYAARLIAKPNGNYQHNKNARLLHTKFIQRLPSTELSAEKHIEVKAFEKHFVPKALLQGLSPATDRQMQEYDARHFADWLAARYSRPALPTAFNNRIDAADPKGALRDKVKKANNELSGMYVEILPFAELKDTERYQVNLLGTVPADFDGDLAKAETALTKHADILRAAKMDVTQRLLKEDEISLAVIRRFKRFYYDDLSYRTAAPLPVEVTG